MSTQLKKKLERIVEEDCRREGTKISTELPKYKDALLKIKQIGKLDLLISVEGTKQINAENDAKILEKLERANLIKGEDKFTHRNNYRQYELTAEGTELLKQLESEP